MIEVKNLTKIYKGDAFEVEALKNVSLKIEDGSFVSIMGESGSGKSTLLNCIGLIDDFNQGEYKLNGTAIDKLSNKERGKIRKDSISFIFQHFELMRNYTAYENIELPLLAKNVKKAKRKRMVRACAEQLNVAELLDKYPYQLSGGQQQRIAIARALVADNPYILADEPTGALDSKNSAELMHILKKINETGKTIIMVTHDIKMAEYSDRIIRLEDGQILC